MLILQFRMGEDTYALDSRQVVRVLPAARLKRLPAAPAGVAGLLNFEGTPVPVLDLSALALGQPAAEHLSTRIILTQLPGRAGESRLLGLLAEHATNTQHCEPADFIPAGITAPAARYLGPVACLGGTLVQRLELERLLTTRVYEALTQECAHLGTD
ncbi:MAG TPA: chemotaxis protein CheW [Steroidobacteraceae bacterium]|nr:chemotaxis protein CheW [Steroidobacteraceae bacterium]